MTDSISSEGTSRQSFLEALLADFRYERNNIPNEFRLYHCTKQGKNRFARYFSRYKKLNDGPWLLDAFINAVDFEPRQVTVEAIFKNENLIRHVVPESAEDREVVQKVCSILDAHPVSRSVVP